MITLVAGNKQRVGEKIYLYGLALGETSDGLPYISGGGGGGGSTCPLFCGSGSPEGVIISPSGGIYEQTDADVEAPVWVKRKIEITTFVAKEWCNGANDTDITGRATDGGDIGGVMATGSWTKHPGAASGGIDLIRSTFVPATANLNVFYLDGLSGLGPNQAITTVWYRDTLPFFTYCGAGARFDTTALSGYLLKLHMANGDVTLNTLVAGVETVLGFANARGMNGDDPTHVRMEIRCIGSTIEGWVNGRKIISADDSTYTSGVGVIWGDGLGGNNPFITGGIVYYLDEVNFANVIASDPSKGWYSQQGLENNRSISIGTGSISDDFIETNSPTGSVAIGYQSQALNPIAPGHSYGCVAVGGLALAVGDGNVSIGDSSFAINDGSTAIGAAATARNLYTTAIGFSSNAYSVEATAVGISSQAGGVGALAVGDACETNNAPDSIALGHFAYVDFEVAAGIAIGLDAYSGYSYSIALGAESSTTVVNQLMIGGAGIAALTEVRFNSGDTVAPNFVLLNAALATNATDGFLYLPTCAGTPTGVPTTYTGNRAAVYDTSNNKLYVYNGAWKSVTLT